MRKIIISLAAMAALPGVAAAQDWSGPYAGVQVSRQSVGAATTLDITGVIATNIPLAVASAEANQPGDLGDDVVGFGAHVGYLAQHGAWVFGGEAGLGTGGDSDAVAVGPVSGGNASASTYAPRLESDWEGSIRLRGGWAGDTVMIYALGGYAWRGVTLSQNYRMTTGAAPGTEGLLAFQADDTVSGWTYGAGVEWRAFDAWGLRLEYAHTDYGDLADDAAITGTFTGSPALQGAGRLQSDLEVDEVRLAASYHF